ncbi:MAG: hypothetical protein Q4C60_04300 [Eubacteriales bacterium]|nr:hypothetical protein [Eubacteriales bacterium]
MIRAPAEAARSTRTAAAETCKRAADTAKVGTHGIFAPYLQHTAQRIKPVSLWQRRQTARSNPVLIQSTEQQWFVFYKRRVVTLMVELDQMKIELQQYETPLAEARDSL